MRLFTPSITPTFRRQAAEFYEAEDFSALPEAPEMAALLEGLDREPDATPYPIGSWWFGSLSAVKNLLIRRVLWYTVSALTALISVIAMQRLIAEEIGMSTVIGLTAIIALAEISKNLIGYFDRLRAANIMRGVQTHLMILVNRKLLNLDPSRDQEFSRGNLKTLVSSDVEAIEDFISAASQAWLPTLAMFSVLTPLIIMNLGWLGVIGIVATLCQVPLAMVFATIISRLKSVTQHEKDNVTTVMGEWVKNIRLVRFLGLQPYFNTQIEHIMTRYTGKAALMHTFECIMWGTSHNWWMFGLASILVGGQILEIPVELNSFLPSCWALLYMMANFNHIPYSISLYGQARASAVRLRKLFECPELTRHIDHAAPDKPLGLPVRLHFKNVTFTYEEKKIFDKFDLQLDLRKKNAILGAVGSGKTTLLELLCGERHPTSGEIEVEFSSGLRSPLWSAACYKEFRSQVAYSPQSPFLSNSKLHQNISLTENSESEPLERAVALAQLGPDIAILRHGLDEEVGETGINLSGGQKQRVSMARAFYSNRPLFVLDDPLSAVDRDTELKLVNDILESATGLILVSHRLEELHHCDRLIVIENGTVAEDGTPSALFADQSSRVNAYLNAMAQRNGGQA